MKSIVDVFSRMRSDWRAKFIIGSMFFCLLAPVGPAACQTSPNTDTQTNPSGPDVANSPTIHKGDVWVDRLASGDKQYKVWVNFDETVAVGQWGTSQVTDKNWNIIVARSLTDESSDWRRYAKPLVIFPFPLTPGKTWKQNVNWQGPAMSLHGKCEIEGKIGNWEDLTVPAGNFHAIKGVATERAIGPEGAHDEVTITYWYAPKVNRFVKYQYQSIDEGDINAELVSYKPASH